MGTWWGAVGGLLPLLLLSGGLGVDGQGGKIVSKCLCCAIQPSAVAECLCWKSSICCSRVYELRVHDFLQLTSPPPPPLL